MKYKFMVTAAAFALAVLSAGCYTQLSTREPSDDRAYADEEEYTQSSDTTDGTVINNYYFGDDAYRHARFRTSFHYYYPGGWGGYLSVYDPWFDDPWYWTVGWRPYVLYPYPTWYPGYYDPYYYNQWGYHHYYDPWYYPGWVGGVDRGNPHRTRTAGMMRDNGRLRPNAGLPLASPASGTAAPSGTRMRDNGAERGTVNAQPSRSGSTTRTRGGDTPWWERVKQEDQRTQQSAPASATQPGAERRRTRQTEQSPNSGTGSMEKGGQQQPQGTTSDRPKRERRERSGESGSRQVAPQSHPHYAPPPSSSHGGGGRERSGGGSSSGGSSSGRSSSGGSSSGGSSRTRSGR
ncbi:MAG: hypothetical protein ACM3Q4_04995 [Acidobacteriota bacterium]